MLLSLTTLLWLGSLPNVGHSHSCEVELNHVHETYRQEVLNIGSNAENGLMFQGFEWYVAKDSQHWKGLIGQLKELATIGVDKIWIPPASKANGLNSTGYDVYDLWDLGEFDIKGHIATSYGTREELITLSRHAASHGIGIIADVVLNQRSGADGQALCRAHRVDPDNRLESTSQSQVISAWVDFSFPARSGKYSNKTWNCADFTAVNYDETSGENAIWKIEAIDNDFATDVSNEHGNYDYLMLSDVAYHEPSVQEDVKAWGAWVAEELDLAGFRLDAAKHISQRFLRDWVDHIKTQTGRGDLLFIAEYLTSDSGIVFDFTRTLDDSVSTFDTPLQIRFHDYSIGASTNLSAVLESTWLSIRPDRAVTYVMNHDTQPGQALDGLNIESWFIPLAYALILLRADGYPCLFWGDLYGVYDDYGWFTPPPYASIIADLALARKYFAYGVQVDYLDNTATIGWTRQGDHEHIDGLAVIMSNEQGTEDQYKIMNVGKQHAGEVWSSIFGGEGQVTIDDRGYARFVTGPGTVNVFTRVDAMELRGFNSWDFTK